MNNVTAENLKAVAMIIAAIGTIYTSYLGRTIHKLVNSAMTAVKEDLRIANARIESLQQLIESMSEPRTKALTIPPNVMIPPSTPPTVAKQ